MPDEADLAQEVSDQFLSDAIMRVARARRGGPLPPCENHEECGRTAFITDKGTVARFCKECWEEFKASR
jgi:hypothetical protein